MIALRISCLSSVLSLGLFAALPAQAAGCDLGAYKAAPGLTARVAGDTATLEWQGEAGAQLRAQFGIQDGQPQVRELAVQEKGGQWSILARNVTPDFQVTAGKRNISSEQLAFLKKNGTDTAAQIEARKWDTFWDAPLSVPGSGAQVTGLPRRAEDIRRGVSVFHSTTCRISSHGSRVSVTFNGLTLGIFKGDLQFTAYKGSNLLRQEAIAQTAEPSVAFIYRAGLTGFAIGKNTKLVWRDTARQPQSYAFGGAENNGPVNLRARNRLEILETGTGSLAVLPPPHKFFFARENEVNLGYVYYRKDSKAGFSLGVMQPEKGEGYKPWGISDAEWDRRSETSREEQQDHALYNAPAGTLQHMAVYYHLSAKNSDAARQAVLAYTHNDVFKPVSGFKVLSGHFHFDFNEMLTDAGNMDLRPEWVSVLRGIGVNVLYLGDFHDDSHPHDSGLVRLNEQKVYFDAAQRVSDKDFLVIPAEEVNSYLGGHWYLMMPKPVYYTHADTRLPSQKFIDSVPGFGQVYHLGSSSDVLDMVNREQAIMWTAHPRTKSSEGYPDTYKDKDFFQSDRFVGASWESLPIDLSQSRLCETRCFGTGDDMSNWAPKPKFMMAEGDTYTKAPDDETYPQLAVNYLKLDHVPAYNESWAPITEGIRAGNFYGTTGEILFHKWNVAGAGAKRTYNVEFEYTYPLEFAELVWSDGKKVDRKIIDLADSMPFGSRKLSIPFDASGKKWVRLAVWDSAGNGAFIQPVALP